MYLFRVSSRNQVAECALRPLFDTFPWPVFDISFGMHQAGEQVSIEPLISMPSLNDSMWTFWFGFRTAITVSADEYLIAIPWE
jgi:hypothetical protein